MKCRLGTISYEAHANKETGKKFETSLTDEGFLDHYGTALIFHLKEESPSQRQRATHPLLPSHAANPLLSRRFAQAQTSL